MVPRKKKQEPKEETERTTPADLAGQEPDSDTTQRADPGTFDEVERRAPTAEQAIEALTDQLEELEDRHLRLVAEFDNFRKRTLRERAQQAERAQAELVGRLLESLDDLSRVSELGSTEHDAAAILEGVQLVEAKLKRALEGFGLKQIAAVGRPFDPEVHEALIAVPTDDPEQDDIVSQEVAKGYLLKDALLRPALVEVKKYRLETADTDDAGSTEGGS